MLKDLVLKDNSGVFLISEAQIVDERFLEDINNLLNIGEIPNLYPPEDKVRRGNLPTPSSLDCC